MGAEDENDPLQTDFSHLRIREITSAQRAELRRRYQAFVRHFDAAGGPPAADRKRVRKWIPGAKH
jgi:hypothetical protein